MIVISSKIALSKSNYSMLTYDSTSKDTHNYFTHLQIASRQTKIDSAAVIDLSTAEHLRWSNIIIVHFKCWARKYYLPCFYYSKYYYF